MQTCREGHREKVLNTPFLQRRWSVSIKMFNFITYSMNADIEKIHSTRGRTCQHLWKYNIFFPFIYAISIIHTWSGYIGRWFRDLHQYVVHQVIILSLGETLVARSLKIFVEYLFHVPYVIVFLGTWLTSFLGIKDLLHEIRLVRSAHSEPLTENLQYSIFSELRIKSRILDPLKNTTTSSRRGWASSHTQIQIADHETLLRYITDVDYDNSLLIWHIATELCYKQEALTKENCDQYEYHTNRLLSKMLSDYMMYLLIMQPKLMSGVAGIGKIRFRDTLAEAERFYKKMSIRNSRSVKLTSEKILSVDTSIEPRDVKGSQSKSVLFEASSLAKELLRLERDYGVDMWTIISKVWMELLSKGGDFINFVWLLMAHFGLGD